MSSKRLFVATLAVAACGGNTNPPPDGPPDTPPVTGTDITVEIHKNFPFVDGDTADEAEFVAVQDGDGAFVAATGANGVYTVHVGSERFGVAVGCNDTASGFVDIEIIQQTIQDGTSYKTVCKSHPATATLDVTVKNLPTGNRLRLRVPANIANATTNGVTSISVPPGTTELFGTLTDANRVVKKLFRIPSINVPALGAAAASVTIDVAADGALPDSGTFTVDPDDPAATARTAIVRPYGSVGLTGGLDKFGASRTYLAMPAVLRQADDLLRVTVSGATGSTAKTAKNPGALAFRLPAQFTAPNPELVKTPFLHPVWMFTPTAAVLPNQSYFLAADNFGDFTSPVLRDWFVTISARWIAGATSVRYEFPDLSGIPGFANVALVDRERIDTATTRLENTAEFNVDGAESTSSSSSGVIGEFCGDGKVQAPETCDPGDAGETATCDSDCTAVSCGDGVTNFAAGEECDPPDGTTCSPACKNL